MTAESRPARSYRCGDWFGVFGAAATVLLPASERARVPGLWLLVDDGAGFDRVLDALVRDGLSTLPGFVLVGHDDPTRLVVRGAATAVLRRADGSTEELDGSTVATWVERSVGDLVSLTLEVGEAADDADLLIGDGLVRVARVDQPPYAGADENALTQRLPTAPTEAAAPGWGPPTSDPLPGGPPPGGPPPGGPPPGGPPPGGPPPAGPPPAGPPPGHVPLGLGGPASTTATRPVARLHVSTGDVVDVDRPVLVGRAPEARLGTTAGETWLVSVPSPQHQISSAHLEVRPGSGADLGTAVVTDLGSTNGTLLQQPGLPPEALPPGRAVPLLPGAVVDLGDGVTIRVSRP